VAPADLKRYGAEIARMESAELTAH
jgi:hypothetical protein